MLENINQIARWLAAIAKGAPVSGPLLILSFSWFLYAFRRDAAKWERYVAGLIFLGSAWNIYDAISMSG